MTLPWIDEANALLGISEIKGPRHNVAITSLFGEVGFPWVRDDETAWCAAFVGACLKRASLQYLKSLRALSYKTFGRKLPRPSYGCIGVKTRKGGGHVFFIVGWNERTVYALGGNQSDKVSVVMIPRKDIIAYRWPADYPSPSEFPDALVYTGNAPNAGSEA